MDDEALGWFGRRLPWGSYGMLARASISAPSLGVALKRWCRHHGLLTDDIALQLQVQAGTASITVTERSELECAARVLLWSRCYEHPRAGLLVGGFAHRPAGYAVPLAAPPHAWAYAVLFLAPPGSRRPGHIRFDAQYLDLPCAAMNAPLRQMLQHACPDRAAIPARPSASAAGAL